MYGLIEIKASRFTVLFDCGWVTHLPRHLLNPEVGPRRAAHVEEVAFGLRAVASKLVVPPLLVFSQLALLATPALASKLRLGCSLVEHKVASLGLRVNERA